MKIDRVARVTMNPEMPEIAITTPFSSPAASPQRRPITAASGIGRPQTSIMPPKKTATIPPMAPTARFICPMPITMAWAKATIIRGASDRVSTA